MQNMMVDFQTAWENMDEAKFWLLLDAECIASLRIRSSQHHRISYVVQ